MRRICIYQELARYGAGSPEVNWIHSIWRLWFMVGAVTLDTALVAVLQTVSDV